MVSADNVNLDVLELVFAHLVGDDLPSVALVSRSFLAAVIPRLYKTLIYGIKQAKRYPELMSPFDDVIAHPALAVHVREVDIQVLPLSNLLPHPRFVRSCVQALTLCINLSTFRCTIPYLPSFLTPLEAKPRLQELRIHSSLTTAQAKRLANIRGLRRLILDHPSWSVMDILPAWASGNKDTLESLAIYMSPDLNAVVLESTLSQLPELTGLHIIRCEKIDHTTILKYLSHTPLLEELSFTTTESNHPLSTPAPQLLRLRQLALDCRYSLSPSPAPTVLAAILDHLFPFSVPGSRLSSFTLKLSEKSLTVGNDFVSKLLSGHSLSLRRLSFMNCHIAVDMVSEICRRCIGLERLEVAVPVKELTQFTQALSRTTTLKALVDVGDPHTNHGLRQTLNQGDVISMMTKVPTLRTIINDSKIWTGCSNSLGPPTLSLERKKATISEHWFMPRTSV